MTRLVAVRHAPAPAKINLFLHVLGRRPDGYHELETVFLLLDMGDTLHVAACEDGRIERLDDVPGVPADDDIMIRAARLLRDAAGTRLGARIGIVKRTPMGGGLGGGSSDAATVLLVLNRLWDLHWPLERLAALALRLGADVPVFVEGRPAYAMGVGERLQPLSPDLVGRLPAHFVVVAPAVHTPTAGVFGDPHLTRDTTPLRIHSLSRYRFGRQASLPGRNDLEPVVIASSPLVAAARQALEKAVRNLGRSPGSVRMTGSGSCVFAAVGNASEAEAVAAQATLARVGIVTVARALPEHPLRRWAMV